MQKKRKMTPAIEIFNVSKTYVLHHEKPTFLEQIFHGSYREKYTALENISLKIFKGESVGIVGPNGAGKTTLLKIISGITTPTSGQVKVNGRVVSLIDLEAGFNPELIGEENIYLNGLIIGMRREEIRRQFKNIVKFAGIGQFINAPLYTYSQGMKLRLGFSVAIYAKPDILILDENMSFGDKDFRLRSLEMIKNFKLNKKTIVFATHNDLLLKELCQKIYLIKDGNLSKIDSK